MYNNFLLITFIASIVKVSDVKSLSAGQAKQGEPIKISGVGTVKWSGDDQFLLSKSEGFPNLIYLWDI